MYLFGIKCMMDLFVNKGERGNGENEKRRERETKDGLEITLAVTFRHYNIIYLFIFIHLLNSFYFFNYFFLPVSNLLL